MSLVNLDCPEPFDPRPKSQDYMDSLIPPSQDNFERIAHVQQEKEEELRRKSKDDRRRSAQPGGPHQHDEAEHDAARVIQKTFRGYRARRELDGFNLNANTRWIMAIREAQFRQSTRPRARSGVDPAEVADLSLHDTGAARPSSARLNWKKAGLVARRAGNDDNDSDSDSSSSLSEDQHEDKEEARKRRAQATAERRSTARMMGLQYFLEMVDVKHRYGSNLRVYHEEWKKSETKENFFFWLDHGEGKYIELDMCPRDRLEREQVRYLSREERLYYQVKVDRNGRLRWAKNDALIDTTEKFKDSIHGIVPADDPTPAFNPSSHAVPTDDDSISDSASESSIESRREADRAAKYAGTEQNHGFKKITHVSAATVFDKLLRKSVRKNTWIFVADTSFRLYVGIKDSGAFQHSSFLQGSRISAAGLIKIKNGRLSSLSPLSGHYRPPAANFRAFVKNLKSEGVDTKHVSISKSYAVLVGLEAYIKTRSKGKSFVGKLVHGRDKIIAPEELKRKEEEAKDKSESAKREREVLEEERAVTAEREEEAKVGHKIIQKLKTGPADAKVGPATGTAG